MKFKILEDKDFKKIIVAFIIIKIIVISTGFIAYNLVPEDQATRQILSDNIFLNPWAQYDTNAYFDIAKNGYNSQFMNGVSNYGWYPLYPLLIKIFSFIGYDLAAFLISNIASFFAIVYLFILIRDEFGASVTKRSILYILLFPTAYFMTAMYTESLFLLFIVASFYYARKDKWLAAGIFGFLAALTRMQGAIMVFPLLYMYFKKYNFALLSKKFVSIFLVPLGSLTFMLYHYLTTGDALIQFHTQSVFSRQITFPWVSITNTFSAITTAQNPIQLVYHFFNVFVLVFFVILLYFAYKKLNKEYLIYFFLSLVIPLFSSTLQAISRFYLVIFPAFMVMAIMGQENKKHDVLLKILYVLFTVALIAFTVWHVSGGLRIFDYLFF